MCAEIYLYSLIGIHYINHLILFLILCYECLTPKDNLQYWIHILFLQFYSLEIQNYNYLLYQNKVSK